ncbi:MAG: GyrI-like domain-containing protein [Anaerolineales bacterium]|nr:GyrI-like domain-containing protein [Anaerolineales bacterium]
MKTLDLKKDLKAYYNPSAKTVSYIEVPRFQFLMVEDSIEPGKEPGNSPLYQQTMEAIYGAAYTLKFMLKLCEKDPFDYPVMPLEGLWTVRDGKFDLKVKDNWDFTSMILTPDQVTRDDFTAAVEELKRKKGDKPGFSRLRLETFEEGPCVQVMHIGPYANELETLERMWAFMEKNGYQDRVGQGGKHHEIYLGDPRRAAPEKLKTILRHPVARKQ